jgi:transcriptional regulator with XRE-family HTH domain
MYSVSINNIYEGGIKVGKTIGQTLRAWRMEHKISVRELAEKTGVAGQTMYNWEHRDGNATFLPLLLVLTGMELTIEDLLRESGADPIVQRYNEMVERVKGAQNDSIR